MALEVKKADLWKAIKQFCYECNGESKAEVAKCTGYTCPLYEYRFGLPMGARNRRVEKRLEKKGE